MKELEPVAEHKLLELDQAYAASAILHTAITAISREKARTTLNALNDARVTLDKHYSDLLRYNTGVKHANAPIQWGPRETLKEIRIVDACRAEFVKLRQRYGKVLRRINDVESMHDVAAGLYRRTLLGIK